MAFPWYSVSTMQFLQYRCRASGEYGGKRCSSTTARSSTTTARWQWGTTTTPESRECSHGSLMMRIPKKKQQRSPPLRLELQTMASFQWCTNLTIQTAINSKIQQENDPLNAARVSFIGGYHRRRVCKPSCTVTL